MGTQTARNMADKIAQLRTGTVREVAQLPVQVQECFNADEVALWLAVHGFWQRRLMARHTNILFDAFEREHGTQWHNGQLVAEGTYTNNGTQWFWAAHIPTGERLAIFRVSTSAQVGFGVTARVWRAAQAEARR